MRIFVDSIEYMCWHEVGHPTACLHFGGDVDFMEILVGDPRGHARTRCITTPDIEKYVACGGFAAEFYLLDKGHAEKRSDDGRDINRIVFHNATGDREDYWGRKLGCDEMFSREEDLAFMDQAVTIVAPTFDQYFPGMRVLAGELLESRRVEGSRVRQILRALNSR